MYLHKIEYKKAATINRGKRPALLRSFAKRLNRCACVFILFFVIASALFLSNSRSLLGAELDPNNSNTQQASVVFASANVPANTIVDFIQEHDVAPKCDSNPNSKLRWETFEESSVVVLRGSDARWQALVSQYTPSGRWRDVTQVVGFRYEPVGIVQIDRDGYVVPLANGSVRVFAQDDAGHEAVQEFIVEQWEKNPTVDFSNQIVPIFSKHGCNGGGCHGKSSGQNGFRLSLMGFEPTEDFTHLVREARGRRINMTLPEESLLLQKSTNEIPHGGGQRLDRDSMEYRLISRWMTQGAKYGDDPNKQSIAIKISPSTRIMEPGATQQLSVWARSSDGQLTDVTRITQFDTNDPQMAQVDAHGKVTIGKLAGQVAIMGRYQGRLATFRATIPMAGDYQTSMTPKNSIDVAVFDQLRQLNIPTSELCDDVTFLRRVSLDLIGRLPTIQELHDFEQDDAPTKRDAVIDRLLESDDHAAFFANKWMWILRNQRDQDSDQARTFAFYRWLKEQIASNRPYDEFVTDILTASGSVSDFPPVAWYLNVKDIHSRVEDASQLFLGQRIQCARCHHHPYEKWSQVDYAKMAAFFVNVQSKPHSGREDLAIFIASTPATMPHPKTQVPMQPSGLGEYRDAAGDSEDARFELADWMTDRDNPYFAKALVNRYWKHLMGRGIVEPEDDMRLTNPPTNPELLDALAKIFTESDYDCKELLRSICRSKTYQLSSQSPSESLNDRQSYSRFYPRRLSAETLVDALDQVCGTKTDFGTIPEDRRAIELPDSGFNSYFLTAFGRPDGSTACECERSGESTLAQSLHLANSKEIQSKLNAEEALPAQLARDPRPDQEKIDDIFLRAFARRPSETQRKAALDYLELQENRRLGYEDLLWAILNSKEFLFNH